MAEELKKTKEQATSKQSDNKKRTSDHLNSLTKFVKDIKSELRKVIWPTKSQLINNTVTVLLACLIVGVIIWGFDIGLDSIRKAVIAK